MVFMQNKLSDIIIIRTTIPLKPLERNVWRNIGLYLNKKVIFDSGEYDGYVIGYGDLKIYSPHEFNRNNFSVRETIYNSKNYRISSSKEVNFKRIHEDIFITADIWTPVICLLNLEEENYRLNRDRYGLVLGKSCSRAQQNEMSLFFDVLNEVVRLLADLIGIPNDPLLPDFPYILVLTFDVDGFLPGQPQQVIDFLREWPVEQPTFMVMGNKAEETTIYDPFYDLEEPSMSAFWENDIEIGLHSSYLAHDNLELLKKQKQHVECKTGHAVRGHRSHYYRFAFPRSWGQQIRAGFSYDASLGYPDIPGNRNGTFFPISFPDPDGFDNKIWTLSTTCLDQHFFVDNSILYWHKEGRKNVDLILNMIKEHRSIITIDWHVHGIDKESFPNHYDPLRYMLDRAINDGALITGIGNLVDKLNERWDNLYNDLGWAKKNSGIIDIKIEQEELENYVKVFSGENLGASSIDAAAMSLLSSLPPDAEYILDIGCGPGLMSRRIPPFYKVLCMDIDKTILSPVIKPNCIGDITDIPLADNEADLVMACDVLEHLNEQELKKAVSEIERVSKKYIYIQVPLLEILEAGTVKCSDCNYCWHLNYHKQTFSLKKLLNLFHGKWVPKTINFTGDVSFTRIPLEYFGIKKEIGYSGISLGDIVCPKCGQTIINHFYNDDIVRNLFHLEFKDFESMFPVYSEIGILFELDGKPFDDFDPIIRTRSGKIKPIPEPTQMNYNSIDYSQPFLESESYSSFELLPIVIPCQIYIIKKEEGIIAVKSDMAINPSLAVAFPTILNTGDIIELIGHTDEQVYLTVLGYSATRTEFNIGEIAVNGSFNIKIPVPRELEHSRGFIRIVWNNSPSINFSCINICSKHQEDSSRRAYLYKYGNIGEFNHIEFVYEGVLFRWILPFEGHIYFSDDFRLWTDKLKLQESLKLPHDEKLSIKCLQSIFRYARSLELETSLVTKMLQNESKTRKEAEDLLKDTQDRLAKTYGTLEIYEDTTLNSLSLINDELNKYKEKNQALTMQLDKALQSIEILEDIVLSSRYGYKKNLIKRRSVKKLANTIVVVAKRYTFLVSLGERLQLRRLYNKLKMKGWV